MIIVEDAVSNSSLNTNLAIIHNKVNYSELLRILYNSLILSHLQYCVLSWGFKSDRIFKLQKRAVRIITCSKYNAHTEPLLKTLNLLKIEAIMKTKALKLY